MKSDKLRLQEYIRKMVKSYLQEAEKEEEENPFAAADDKGGEEGGEEAAAGGEEGEEKEKAPAKPEQPAGVPINFNASRVKKYNDANFRSDSGIVKSISKKGVVVTVEPDQVDVFVNFDDITENAHKFFKIKK